MDALIGSTLGQCHIVEQIGEGGMATVYKAYQPGLDRYVAIKILPPVHAQQAGFKERFEREAKAIANLNHPNILPIYDSGYEGDYSYIVMRYVEGARTLKEVMRDTLDLAQVTDLIGQIATALDYAHQRGIIHRDVKPSNVLMDGNWALLTDFGLAKMVEASVKLTGTGVGIGTPAYMSPEQGQGAEIDHRTDIYALGIILFEMLTGKIPHDADTPFAIVLKRMSDPLPRPSELNPDIPEAVERVILKALARNPDDRFVSAGALAAALEQAASQSGVERQPLMPVYAETSTSTIDSLPTFDEQPSVARTTSTPTPMPIPAAAPARRSFPWQWIIAGAGIIALFASAWIVFEAEKSKFIYAMDPTLNGC